MLRLIDWLIDWLSTNWGWASFKTSIPSNQSSNVLSTYSPQWRTKFDYTSSHLTFSSTVVSINRPFVLCVHQILSYSLSTIYQNSNSSSGFPHLRPNFLEYIVCHPYSQRNIITASIFSIQYVVLGLLLSRGGGTGGPWPPTFQTGGHMQFRPSHFWAMETCAAPPEQISVEFSDTIFCHNYKFNTFLHWLSARWFMSLKLRIDHINSIMLLMILFLYLLLWIVDKITAYLERRLWRTMVFKDTSKRRTYCRRACLRLLMRYGYRVSANG